MFDPAKYRMIDLTMPYRSGMSGFSKSIAKTIETDGWNASTLNFYSHAGTHMDAPFHFGVSDQSIDQYNPDRFVGKAWVIDVPITEDHQLIKIDTLRKIKILFKGGDSLIFRTSWSDHFGSTKYRDHLPRISEELAQWCVDHRVNMLAVEPPSVADVNHLPEVTKIHQILLGGDIIIIEGLQNTSELKKESVTLIALPLLIENGDGAPTRVIALEEK